MSKNQRSAFGDTLYLNTPTLQQAKQNCSDNFLTPKALEIIEWFAKELNDAVAIYLYNEDEQWTLEQYHHEKNRVLRKYESSLQPCEVFDCLKMGYRLKIDNKYYFFKYIPERHYWAQNGYLQHLWTAIVEQMGFKVITPYYSTHYIDDSAEKTYSRILQDYKESFPSANKIISADELQEIQNAINRAFSCDRRLIRHFWIWSVYDIRDQNITLDDQDNLVIFDTMLHSSKHEKKSLEDYNSKRTNIFFIFILYIISLGYNIKKLFKR